MKKTMNPQKQIVPIVAKNENDLGVLLGLNSVETATMIYRAELAELVSNAIEKSLLTHAQIAQIAGTARATVTRIAQLNTQSISSDLLVRVLAATGYSVKTKMVKLSSKSVKTLSLNHKLAA